MHHLTQLIAVISCIVCIIALPAAAQNSKTITLTGQLFDSQGVAVGSINPVVLDVQVELYDQETGGTMYYSETFKAADSLGIAVENGLLVVHLGTGTTSDDLERIVDTHDNLWVELNVDGDILSRTPLSSAPYSIIKQSQTNL